MAARCPFNVLAIILFGADIRQLDVRVVFEHILFCLDITRDCFVEVSRYDSWICLLSVSIFCHVQETRCCCV